MLRNIYIMVPADIPEGMKPVDGHRLSPRLSRQRPLLVAQITSDDVRRRQTTDGSRRLRLQSWHCLSTKSGFFRLGARP